MKTVLNSGFEKNRYYLLADYENGEMFPAVSDTMFLTMFNNESRKQYVSYLLSLMLDKDYDTIYNNIVFQKEKLDKSNFYDKGQTVDLVCTVDNAVYNVEMNSYADVSVLEKNLRYGTGLFGETLRIGDSYKYDYVLSININNFNFKGNTKTIDEAYIKNSDNKVLTDKIKIVYVSLPLIDEKLERGEALNAKELFFAAINAKDSKNLEKVLKGDKIMQEYRKDALEASQEDRIIGLYDKEKMDEYLKREQEKNQELEIKKSHEQGIEQEKYSIATNLLKNNVSLDIISTSTGLDIEILKQIKVEHNI